MYVLGTLPQLTRKGTISFWNGQTEIMYCVYVYTKRDAIYGVSTRQFL